MNSRQESRANFILNRFGASEQMKIFFSLIFFSIALALLIPSAYAATVTLNTPAAGYYNNSSEIIPVLFNCSAAVTGPNALTNISLYITNSSNSSFTLNQTTAVTGMGNSSAWSLNLSRGNYTWNCEAYETTVGYAMAAANRTVLLNHTYECGDTIAESVTLTADLINCTANGLELTSGNIILNCNGHSIQGNSNHTTDFSGIYINVGGSANVTIENCNISGFAYGIDNYYGATGTAYNSYFINNNISNIHSAGIITGNTDNLIKDNIVNHCNEGIFAGYADGTSIVHNVVNNTYYGDINEPGNGIILAFTGKLSVINNTIINSNQSGIYIRAQEEVNVTGNNISSNGNAGIYIYNVTGGDFTIKHIWNNNIYSNVKNVISEYDYWNGASWVWTTLPIQLSYGNSGNYWGHNGCPVFTPGNDSNGADVIDSYAYNASNGWITTTPAICAPTIVSFKNSVTSLTYENVGIEGDMTAPHNITLSVNITNTSAAWVNLTRGLGICLGPVSNNQQMTYVGGGIFGITCTANKTALAATGAQYNLTAVAYYVATPASTNTQNFTINNDFTPPVVNFKWWATEDVSGSPVSLVSPFSMFDGQDIFFSPTDNWVRIKVNVTDNNNVSYVEANFTTLNTAMATTGGNCTNVRNLTYLGSTWWGYNCSLGTYNRTILGGPVLEAQPDVQLTAYDTYGNPTAPLGYNTSISTPTACTAYTSECMPIVTPIMLQDIGVMGPTTIAEVNEMCGGTCTDPAAYCFLFGPSTTNFSSVTNFSNVNFAVEMKVNLSCLAAAGEIDSATGVTMPATFTTMMILNMTGIDMSSQETAAKLAQLPDNIEVQINAPNEFEQSYIYVNSTAFEELDTTTTIMFFHLPFTAAPNITWSDAAGTTGSSTWTSGTDSFWGGLIAGNLTFNVGGFSDYNISDTVVPIVTINAPAAASTIASTTTWLNLTLNGTGTQISNVLVYDGATLKYNNSATPGSCFNVTQGSEKFFCNISLTGLADGNHTLTVYAFDYGANEPGNNASATRTFTVDTTGPVASGITAWNTTNSSATINATTNELANCTVNYGTTSAYGSNSAATATGTTHTKMISSLSAGTLYYYRWNCTDVYNNSAVSTGYTFTTAIYNTTLVDNTTTINMTFNFTDVEDVNLELSLNQTLNATVGVSPSSSTTNTFSVSGITGLGVYYTIESGQVNSTNIEWITIKLYYTDAQVPSGINESSLRLYWYNTTSSAWEVVTPGGVDTVNNYVWGNVSHMSEYTIGGAANTEETTRRSTGTGGSIPSTGLTHEVNLDTQITYTQTGMAVKDKINFTLNGEKHVLTLSAMMFDQVVVDISSTSQRITVDMNTPKAVDVNGDGTNDMTVTLTKVSSGRADLTLTKITATGETATPETTTAPAQATPAAEEQEPTVTVISEGVKAVTSNYGVYIIAAVALIGIVAVVYFVFLKKR